MVSISRLHKFLESILRYFFFCVFKTNQGNGPYLEKAKFFDVGEVMFDAKTIHEYVIDIIQSGSEFLRGRIYPIGHTVHVDGNLPVKRNVCKFLGVIFRTL